MEKVALEIIQVLQYLLPGLLAAWVFYGLTSFSKPSEFERIVQALIFTLLTQALVFIEKAAFHTVASASTTASWNDRLSVLCSTISAIALGLTFAFFANNDKFHALLRRARITKETSYPSEWYGAFDKNVTLVVLHLEGERRLYGWVVDWPSDPSNGQILLEQASWINDDGKETPLTGVKAILVNVKDVIWVEFMERTWEKQNGKESAKSTSS